jgi:translation initiation factor 6
MMKTSYFGNPWIGMFIKTNDRTTLVPIDSMEKFDVAVRESLKTETIKIGISDSNLIGVYVAMNSSGIILPNIVAEREVELIRKSGLNVHVSAERHNAHGNNIAVNDKGGIINHNVERHEAQKMEDVLGVELVPMSVAGFSTVGSAVLATNEGFLAHFKAAEEEMAALSQALKVSGRKGTVNTGTGFVGYGAVVNRNGYIVGEDTTPFEIGRLEEALGLIR